MIRLILLTGFLGAGKTTFLQRLLVHYQNIPIGLIVNDFGSINIDARLLEQDGISMAELENGSIFCSCIKGNFINALIELSSKNIHYLFIEASGLADPGNMHEILTTIKSRCVRSFTYKGSVCILDGESFLEMVELLPAIENQLHCANSVLVNKLDLLNSESKNKILEKVRTINKNSPVNFSSFCKVDIDDIFKSLQSHSSVTDKSSNTPENRLTSLSIKPHPSLKMEEFRNFLDFIAPYTYRIKGFVCISGKPYSVSCVRSHSMIMPWSGDITNPKLVLISAVGIGITSAIARGIRKHAPGNLIV